MISPSHSLVLIFSSPNPSIPVAVASPWVMEVASALAVLLTGAGLSLYDNRNPHDGCSAAGTCEDARFIELELDGAAATVVTERSFGRSCPTQGSVTELASGNLLISCAETGSVVELDPTGNVAWELELSCASGGGGPLYRALPLDL